MKKNQKIAKKKRGLIKKHPAPPLFFDLFPIKADKRRTPKGGQRERVCGRQCKSGQIYYNNIVNFFRGHLYFPVIFDMIVYV